MNLEIAARKCSEANRRLSIYYFLNVSSIKMDGEIL